MKELSTLSKIRIDRQRTLFVSKPNSRPNPLMRKKLFIKVIKNGHFFGSQRYMLKNYFKIAFRQLKKQKMYSAIKIGGFALGIAACLLIALFIRDELGYDKNYVHGDRIYRLLHEYDNNGKARLSWSNQAPIAVTLVKDFPEVEKAARMLDFPLFK